MAVGVHGPDIHLVLLHVVEVNRPGDGSVTTLQPQMVVQTVLEVLPANASVVLMLVQQTSVKLAPVL